MRILHDLLINIPATKIIGDSKCVVKHIQIDSRKVSTGDCFVAIKGTASDGHNYIEQCIDKGARVIVCEELPSNLHADVTYVLIGNTSNAVGLLAANFYGNPSQQIKVIGVTGTNGKTSTVTLLFRLMHSMGKQVGLLSTVQNQINEEVMTSTHTTPNAIELQQLLKRMVDAGCEYCFMEVSSHAVVQERIAGLKFTGAVFTNITHDHLDYHKTFENYLKAKKKFFDDLPLTAFALVNADDRNGKVMLQNTQAQRSTFALRTPADFKCKVVENSIAGLHLEIDNTELYTRLIGEFNAYNITAVYGVARLLGFEKHECLTALSSIDPPDGRFEQVVSSVQKITGIVDYAHTPDALKNVLHTINAIRNGNEKIITVVGCGGDRDAAKRPVMAAIASRFSQQVIFTSDNPRSEEPNDILQQMNEGVPANEKKKVLTIADRREAIRTAVQLALPNDIILLAGKGHEKYQEIKGVKTHFDDKEELVSAFLELGK